MLLGRIRKKTQKKGGSGRDRVASNANRMRLNSLGESLQESALPKESSSKLSNMIKGIKKSSVYFMFLISQKPLNNVDEEFAMMDHGILDDSVLEAPIEFNRVYLFNYKASGDESAHKKVFRVEDIDSVQAKVHAKSFNLSIAMDGGKTYIFTYQTAYECLLWLKGLRKALTTQDEVLRSNFGVLRYNIRILYKYFSKHKEDAVQDIVGEIYGDLSADDAVDDFLASLDKTNSEVQFFCDAFFSYKPFIQTVFEVVIRDIHCRIRVTLMHFWNNNFERLSAGEILRFGKLVRNYAGTLEKWGVTDAKLARCFEPVAQTFCAKLFKSSREMLFNVIEDSFVLCHKENAIFKSDSLRILEAHINICFENYDQFPAKEMAKELVKMVTRMLTIVQVNLLMQIESKGHAMEHEVLVSLINCDFEAVIRSFIKKVHKKTDSSLGLNEIRKLTTYNYLQRNNLKINEVGIKTLFAKIRDEMKEVYHSQRANFEHSKFELFLKEFSLLYLDVLLGFKVDFERADIVERLVLEILRIYMRHFLDFLGYINPANLARVVAKIQRDHLLILQMIRPIVGKNVDYMINIQVTLLIFLSTCDPDKIRISILKMLAFFGEELLDLGRVLALIETKIYLSDEQQFWLKEEFKLNFQRHEELVSRKKAEIKRLSPINSTVLKFAGLLVKKHRKQTTRIKRAKTKLFKPQNSDYLEQPFNVEDIYNFYSSCYLIKFPNEIDDNDISEFLTEYITSTKKWASRRRLTEE